MSKPPRQETATIAMTGVFDMANYGDAMFPLVAEAQLAPFGIEIRTVAPTARTVPLADAHQPVALADLADLLPQVDGLLIGGGHILHSHPLDLIVDYTGRPEAAWAGPGLWLGAAALAVQAGVPMMFNGPGMPHPLPRRWQALAHHMASASDYLTVRDNGSARLLQDASGVAPAVVPDPIANIARLWPLASLTEEARGFLAQHDIPADTGLLAVHLRDRSLSGTTPQALAADLDARARQLGLHPVLFALGRAHEDERTAASVARHMTTAPTVYDRPASLRQVTAVLAHCAAYVGASLHGFIVAQAYGVPSLLVTRPAYRKFSGYLDWIGAPEAASPDWSSALDQLDALPLGTRGAGVPDRVIRALAAHWARIAEIAISGSPAAPAEARQAFVAFLQAHRAGHRPIEEMLAMVGRDTAATEVS